MNRKPASRATSGRTSPARGPDPRQPSLAAPTLSSRTTSSLPGKLTARAGRHSPHPPTDSDLPTHPPLAAAPPERTKPSRAASAGVPANAVHPRQGPRPRLLLRYPLRRLEPLRAGPRGLHRHSTHRHYLWPESGRRHRRTERPDRVRTRRMHPRLQPTQQRQGRTPEHEPHLLLVHHLHLRLRERRPSHVPDVLRPTHPMVRSHARSYSPRTHSGRDASPRRSHLARARQQPAVARGRLRALAEAPTTTRPAEQPSLDLRLRRLPQRRRRTRLRAQLDRAVVILRAPLSSAMTVAGHSCDDLRDAAEAHELTPRRWTGAPRAPRKKGPAVRSTAARRSRSDRPATWVSLRTARGPDSR
jgi:hypothetical protein